MDNNKDIFLSVVVTCYNDSEIIESLVNEIEITVLPITTEYEIVLVNDFSPDNSDKIIELICSQNRKVKGISLSRNFGQQIAMSAGISIAKGKYIVIMDGDYQNPPEAIPTLIEKIQKENKDIVYCVSKKRNNLIDELSSELFWFTITKIFNIKMVRNQLMMKIFTKELADRYALFNEKIRTVTGIMNDISSNYTMIQVENNKRKLGKSNYTFFNRMNLMLDFLVSISNHPLNIMIYLGGLIFFITIIYSISFLFIYFFCQVPSGYTSLILSIFFFGSLNLLLLGFIGKYLSNIYTEVRNRPLFHIKKTYNL